MAIIIAVVATYLSTILGGDVVSKTIFKNLTSPYIGFAVIITLFILLINVIFIFAFIISKLSNQSIASLCRKHKGKACVTCDEKNCNPFKHLYRRYYYMVVINLTAVFIIILLMVLSYLTHINHSNCGQTPSEPTISESEHSNNISIVASGSLELETSE